MSPRYIDIVIAYTIPSIISGDNC